MTCRERIPQQVNDQAYLTMLLHEEQFMQAQFSNDPLVKKALTIASMVHAREKTKRGEPYLEAHVLPIMAKAAPFGPEAMATALLHDVIESGAFMTVQTLRDAGFPEVVVNAVDALTRRDGESRRDYIQRCMLNPLSLLIKLIDEWWNESQLKRLAETDYNTAQSLRKRYKTERPILLQTLLSKWFECDLDE